MDKLQVGDKLRTADGTWAQVLEVKAIQGEATVYNFEVEKNHNYFVGSLSVLAHNQTTCSDILTPNGQPIGQPGTSPDIRELIGDVGDAQKMFDDLTKGGQVVNKPTYPGTITQVPEGGTVGLRTQMSKSPGTNATIDVNVPNIPVKKVKFNP